MWWRRSSAVAIWALRVCVCVCVVIGSVVALNGEVVKVVMRGSA